MSHLGTASIITMFSGALTISRALYWAVGSPCVTDSGHISAAVEKDMTVVILRPLSWEGLDPHRHTHSEHIHGLKYLSNAQVVSGYM